MSEHPDIADSRMPRGLVRPAGRLLGLLLAWWLIGALCYWFGAASGVISTWMGIGVLIAIIALIDALRLLRERPGFEVTRHLPERWPVDAPVTVQTEIAHRGTRSIEAMIHDLHPGSIRSEGLPKVQTLQPGQRHRLFWRATARHRGAMALDGIHLAWQSPLGFWSRRIHLERRDPIRVYPNFNLVVQYGRLAGDRRLQALGIHQQQRRGSGSDFHQLRDYREGDSLRQVDWHATSRMRKLIAKDYQEERNQRVVFLLDCSRRMRIQDDGLSHFDRCLNAMLLLAHVALKQGDEVSLQTLAAADGRERRLPAGRGQRQFGALLETVYDLDAGLGHPDFLGAAGDLMRSERRRSLVVLLTNLRDEDHEDLDPALSLMRQRHLVVLADLRESLDELEGPADGRPLKLESALLQAGNSLYRAQRQAATRKLRQLGIIHLDLRPDQLAGALVSQYRKLKATGVF
ncbi:DUF58 domain-containing protein [Wenzhouxiangella marina]|uniref:DUF58 domain-containing protein n=1 Tax=Wenzhouxiangella marina TaxID=1579979 RepID=A0A0K0XV29_9GAMM|nr:DUF58 domain-containing protein [Wenzhouxiangella marina]AKS41569.1 hypothetical protein WM2015_1195 [Wenzhouxiangella marina]MBB6086672.1 uncharacterized protein (DUF58 family) [Wenzhouxiangella marina]